MESFHGSTSSNVAVQDGPGAGQSVPHVHVHILPRRPTDFANNDDVYEALEGWGPWRAGESVKMDVPEEEVSLAPLPPAKG